MKILTGLAAVWLILASSAAMGQRTQMASPVDSGPGTSSPGTATATPAPNYSAPPASSVYPSQPLGSPTPPASSTFAPSGSTLSPGPAPALPPAAPSSSIYTPGTGAVVGAPAAPSSSIYTPGTGVGVGAPVAGAAVTQPPASNWDPYATPNNTPSALLPNDPYFQSSPQISMAAMQKFVQHVNLSYDWFVGNPTPTNRELGINDVDLNVTFAFPMCSSIQTPLLVTPGFAVHYWEGPVSVAPLTHDQSLPADLPPQTYDAYLDFAWNPQISDTVGVELSVRPGVYSDFKRVTSDSIRCMGKGMVTFKLWPHVTLKGGVWYLDRVQTRILPAGGIVWTPNDSIYFNILFPNPKIGKRLTTWGNTEWWLYGSGDYGGGTWTIKRNSGLTDPPYHPWQHPMDGSYTRFDYNDIRIAAGLEFKTLRQMEGHFEVGLSCSRELVYQDNAPRNYFPTNTVYLGAGLTY